MSGRRGRRKACSRSTWKWFAGVDDPSLLDLLDPIDPGTVDPRGPAQWRADVLREYGPPARTMGVHNFDGTIWIWRYAD